MDKDENLIYPNNKKKLKFFNNGGFVYAAPPKDYEDMRNIEVYAAPKYIEKTLPKVYAAPLREENAAPKVYAAPLREENAAPKVYAAPLSREERKLISSRVYAAPKRESTEDKNI